MSHTTSAAIARILLLCCAFFAVSQTGAIGQSSSIRPVIVRVKKSGGLVIREVDSKRAGSSATDDLLYLLNDVVRRKGENYPVSFYIDSRLPISEIWNLNGVAGKAQLSNLHFFIFFVDGNNVTEIKWGDFPKSPVTQ